MKGLILDTDTAAKEATDAGLIAMLLMRHSALTSASQDNPRRRIYEDARDSAEAELAQRLKKAEAVPRVVELERDLRVLIDCLDNLECQCLEPPEEWDGDPSDHSQYCPYYLIGYMRAALDGRPRPA